MDASETDVQPSKRRGRGRPAGSDPVGRRKTLLAAATTEFEDTGFDGATMRAVARRAGVDPSLLHHYFGTKADLFAEAIGLPVRPDHTLKSLLAEDPGHAGEGLVRWLLEVWSDPVVVKRGTTLLRAGLGEKALSPVIRQFMKSQVVGTISHALDVRGTPDAGLRAELVATQVVGLLLGRYVVELPHLVGATDEQLVAWYAPTIQRYMDDDPSAGFRAEGP
jgi:AcrR family transcriptional regulator